MRITPFILLLPLWFAISSCGGSSAVVAPPVEPVPAPAGPSFVASVLDGRTVVFQDLRTGARQVLGDIDGEVVARFSAPDGRSTVLAIAAADSVRLVRVDPASSAYSLVAALPRPVVYTVAWAPDGSRFAYGHYRPTTRDARPAMGEGDILMVEDGAARTVGCSASRAVLSWLPGDRLLVRGTDNLYVVDGEGCETRATVDARRMHQLVASPDGAHVAYVHRELVYDRASRQYVADSTFMIAGSDGSDARTVVGFRYRPSRFAWSPDGSELGYDVQNPDRPAQRLISIFDVASGRSSYLHPPSAEGPSEYDPRWAPDGSRILYRQDSMLAVRTFADPYAEVLEGTEGADPIGWAGSDAAVVRLASGVTRVFPLDGGDAFDLPAGEVLVVVPGGR